MKPRNTFEILVSRDTIFLGKWFARGVEPRPRGHCTQRPAILQAARGARAAVPGVAAGRGARRRPA
jgi:hypothetical protein